MTSSGLSDIWLITVPATVTQMMISKMARTNAMVARP